MVVCTWSTGDGIVCKMSRAFEATLRKFDKKRGNLAYSYVTLISYANHALLAEA